MIGKYSTRELDANKAMEKSDLQGKKKKKRMNEPILDTYRFYFVFCTINNKN